MVGSRKGFQCDFTIKLKLIEGLLEATSLNIVETPESSGFS